MTLRICKELFMVDIGGRPYKRCPNCHHYVPANDKYFTCDPNRPSKLSSWCKVCTSRQDRERRIHNKSRATPIELEEGPIDFNEYCHIKGWPTREQMGWPLCDEDTHEEYCKARGKPIEPLAAEVCMHHHQEKLKK